MSPTISVTEFTSTGAGNALTLANGTTVGFEKTLTHSVKGASGIGCAYAGSSHFSESPQR